MVNRIFKTYCTYLSHVHRTEQTIILEAACSYQSYLLYNSKRSKYSELSVKKLQSWQSGVSGNPAGRPKGSRNLKSVVRELLSSPDTFKLLPNDIPRGTSTPLEAIICTLMVKAIAGDVRACDVVLKYAIDRDEPAEEPGGFFSKEKLIIEVVGADYKKLDELDEVNEGGQLVGFEEENL